VELSAARHYPPFGLEDDRIMQWCGKPGHGRADKDNMKNRRYKEEGCKTRATFGLAEDKIVRWCEKVGHGQAVKEDLRSKQCEEEGCKTRANFRLASFSTVLCSVKQSING